MRPIQITCAAVLTALLLAACSPKGSAIPAGGLTASSDSMSADTSLGKATFSALIDGAPVAGGPIDNMQQQNAAYTIPGSDGAPTLLFYLSDMQPGEDGSTRVTHSFRVMLPKAPGAASNAYIGLSMNLDASHAARYSTASATVTITSITATRVTGTFSGTMKLSPDTPNVPKRTVTITEGKFDIPVATSKLIPS
jgi:hypothetical protein